MKDYLVVGEFETEENLGLQDRVNNAAREGYRPILMTTTNGGKVTVLMERNSYPKRKKIDQLPTSDRLK
jgi:hypothetical protein